MIALNNISKVYMLGVGGIGMSALARYFINSGKQLFGYDKTPSRITDELQAEGAVLHFNEDVNQIPLDVDLVVFTPAIPTDNKEYQYFVDKGINLYKRAEVLGQLTNGQFTIAVAGSHGKTTVTSMIAHILAYAGLEVTALIGGICKNFKSNFYASGNKYFVVEADEYDRSFLQLQPNVAVVTSMDNDHLEVYPTEADLKQAFNQFANQIKKGGKLIVNKICGELDSEVPSNSTIEYHLDRDGTSYRAKNITIQNGNYVFICNNQKVVLQIGGRHNVENAIAAFATACEIGIEPELVAEALNTFEGIERRFDFVLKEDDVIFIDDYAHHPHEVTRFIEGVKELYPSKKITAIFQPHLFSRTQMLAKPFAQALSAADRVVLMDIYPAREKAVEGVTSRLIQQYIEGVEQRIFNTNDVTEAIKVDDEIVVTIGAGDIGNCIQNIKNCLTKIHKIN